MGIDVQGHTRNDKWTSGTADRGRAEADENPHRESPRSGQCDEPAAITGERKRDATDVRREKGVGLQWVQFPPGNWVASAGSYRSGGGGNETVGAVETDVSLWRYSEPTGRNASER